MITLSNRLKGITDMVAPCCVTADIGCDHCLTLMYLIENGICERGIGSEIKDGPLDKALQNIMKFGYYARVELRKGYGLSQIRKYEADAVIISGMGGYLIIDILAESLNTAKAIPQLILQPQNDAYSLRKWLHGEGFKIINENMVTDAGKYYTIIKAAKGRENYENEADYLYGRLLIENKNTVLAEYIVKSLAENQKILMRLAEQGALNADAKTTEINKKNIMMEELLKCL